jgi:hypothetical protein
MIYETGLAWQEAKQKKVLLFAMSGLGKTHVSSMLRSRGDWFHYSVDYRIGTHYMGEHIVDNFKKAAMEVPFLADLLLSNSIYIASNITFENLTPLSTYLGKPGDASEGGIPFAEYCRRQRQHEAAEKSALLDTSHFISRALDLADNLLLVWIEGTEAHTQELVDRFDQSPKPMCYQPTFLLASWQEYQSETGLNPDKVNPDDFIRWTYARALAHRQPRYKQMAKWGITLHADDIKAVSSPKSFENLVASALDLKTVKSA